MASGSMVGRGEIQAQAQELFTMMASILEGKVWGKLEMRLSLPVSRTSHCFVPYTSDFKSYSINFSSICCV